MDLYLLIIMCLLVCCSREKYLFSSPLTTATSLWNDLWDLIGDKLLTHLRFMFAISDQVLYVCRSFKVRISQPMVKACHTIPRSVSNLILDLSFHWYRCEGRLSNIEWLWFLHREIVWGSVFNVHGAELFEVFRALEHVGFVEFLVWCKEDSLAFFRVSVFA